MIRFSNIINALQGKSFQKVIETINGDGNDTKEKINAVSLLKEYPKKFKKHWGLDYTSPVAELMYALALRGLRLVKKQKPKIYLPRMEFFRGAKTVYSWNEIDVSYGIELYQDINKVIDTIEQVPELASKIEHVMFYGPAFKEIEKAELAGVLKRKLFRNIKSIVFFGCNLKEIPETMKNCESLEDVDFHYSNQIKTVPSWMFQLPKLKTLDVSNNEVTDVFIDAHENGNVEHLFLEFNPFLKVTEEIAKLSNLKRLFLGGQGPIPSSVTALQKLTSISVHKRAFEVSTKEVQEFITSIETHEIR